MGVGKVWTKKRMPPESTIFTSERPDSYLATRLLPVPFYETVTLAVSSLSTPLNGGQLSWVLFSWRTTDVSKNQIREREKRRWQTWQNPTVVLHPFTLPTWLLPLWLESLPKILIFIQTALKTSKLENDKISLKEQGMKLQNSNFLASPIVVCVQIPETGHQSASITIFLWMVVTPLHSWRQKLWTVLTIQT